MIYCMEFPNLFLHSSMDSSSILLLQTDEINILVFILIV